jgi:dTDP-4-dehydrorhamnose 3,5-epimerase
MKKPEQITDLLAISSDEKKFEELTGMNGHFVQDNISKSAYGVLRGLHLQKGEHAQAKLVSCLEG